MANIFLCLFVISAMSLFGGVTGLIVSGQINKISPHIHKITTILFVVIVVSFLGVMICTM